MHEQRDNRIVYAERSCEILEFDKMTYQSLVQKMNLLNEMSEDLNKNSVKTTYSCTRLKRKFSITSQKNAKQNHNDTDEGGITLEDQKQQVFGRVGEKNPCALLVYRLLKGYGYSRKIK